jgi:WD40 repeat protein
MMIRQSRSSIVDDFCSNSLKVFLESRSRWGVSAFVPLLTTLLWLNWTSANFAGPAEKPERRFTLSEDEWPQCVAFSSDGRKLYAGTNAGRLWIWELKKKAIPKKIRLTSGGLLTGSVLCLALSPDGHRALAGCADYKVRVVDLDTAKVTHILQGHEGSVFSVAFDRDGQRALSGSSGDKTIFLWDLKTGKSVRRYEGEEWVDSLAIAPDGRRFVATEFLSVQEWDLHSGKRLRSLKGHEYRIHAVFYSPDGQTIISGGYDRVRVWDVKTGRCLRTVGDGKFNADYFALSPDGRRILLGRAKEMQLLDLKDGKELKRWEGLEGNVHVAFSPDGRYALSGEEQGPVSLWSLPKVSE